MTKKSDAPAIRFKGFSDAWEQRKLGDMMNVTSVKRIHQSDWTDSGVRFLRARDIVAAAKNEEPDDYLYISKEKYEEYSALSGKVGVSDLLVTGVGTIGVPYLVRNLEPLYFKDGNIIWFQNSSRIDGKFLFYSFSAEQIQGFINESAGIGTVGTYTIESGKKTPISLPNQIEQARVGEFFQQLDNLITLHQRKFEKLTNVKKSMLEKMFPQNGSSYPEIRFKGFTDPWEQRKFSDITFLAGEKNRDNLPLESYSITNEHGFVPQDEKFENGGTMREADKRMYYIVSPNSFAYNPARINVGSIGYQNVGKNVIVSSLYEVFKTSEDVDDRLLWHWFKSPDFQKLIMQLQEGGVRLYFYYDKLCMGEVSLPSLEEQRKIGKLFDTLDNLITLHQRQPFLHSTPEISLTLQLIHPFYTSSWEQRKAIDIADYSKGNGYSKGDLTDAGTPIILYGRLYTKYQFAISEVDTFAVPRNGAVYSQGNEVIVPASGETAEDIARASAVEKSGVLLGGDLNILRPFDFINPLFLALAISNGEPQKELAKKAQGKSVVHIHNTDIQEVTIAYPSKTEQDRIVSVFRHLDHLITLHQRKGKAAVTGCSNDANNSKGVYCKARDFGYKCYKKSNPNRFDA